MQKKDFRAKLSPLKQLAFTLAETLIVMGIIGVVAALTLPNLNSSTGEKEKVVKLQKIYSNLQDAFGRATAIYGPTDEWCSGLNDANCSKKFFERLTEFMKYSKQCTISDNCSLLMETSGLSGGHIIRHGVILADGTAVDIYGYSNGEAYIWIDIDGLNKGANKACFDCFQFHYKNEKCYISGKTRARGDYPNINYSCECTAWVLDFGNMDYLKVDSSGKCPDGKTILNWTTNTTCK